MAKPRKMSDAMLRSLPVYGDLSQYFSMALLKHAITFFQRLALPAQVDEQTALYSMKDAMGHNPYDLIGVPYLTLTKIDELVTSLPADHPWHIDYDSNRRVDAMLKAVLSSEVAEGRAILNKQRMIDLAVKVITMNTPNMTGKMAEKIRDRLWSSPVYQTVEYDENGSTATGIMSRDYYNLTYQLAQKLLEHAGMPQAKLVPSALQAALASIQGITLSLDQQESVKQLLMRPVSVLTGYAGVGKSTLVRAVVDYLDRTGQTYQLCAHAGKAAFNLAQLTRSKAKTIASLVYSHARLRVQYLIVDEISMVSEMQLLRLLDLVTPETHIIMIGDRAQLPAVEGVGMLTSLLRYLDSSNAIHRENLTHVFRQGKNHLLDAATNVRNHLTPGKYNFKGDADQSIKYAKISDIDVVMALYDKAIKAYGSQNVSIITPLNRDVNWFNMQLQKQYSVGKPRLRVRNSQFFEGDKVLVTENMYGVYLANSDQAVNIFNGFVGRVVSINDSPIRPSMRVIFDNVRADGSSIEVDVYENPLPEPDAVPSFGQKHNATIDAFELGYALTVHKAQGSTIDTVLYYLDKKTTPFMLTVELFYTALTRAKKLFFLSNQDIDDDLLKQYVHTTAYRDKSSYLAQALADCEAASTVALDDQQPDPDDNPDRIVDPDWLGYA